MNSAVSIFLDKKVESVPNAGRRDSFLDCNKLFEGRINGKVL